MAIGDFRKATPGIWVAQRKGSIFKFKREKVQAIAMKVKDPLTFMAIGYIFGVAGTILGKTYLDSYALGAGIGLFVSALLVALLRR